MALDLKGKRLLILGGIGINKKIVEAAKEMGLYTIVTDYIVGAPAKKIADKFYDINVNDVDGIVKMCKEEKVDAVISLCLDFCQTYYQEICEKLNLPCYGTKEQFNIFTNKELFKKTCKKYGVDTIPEYTEDQLDDKSIYPLFIKPSHSCGSKGQHICYTPDGVYEAIEDAKRVSSDGCAVVERYMGGKQDFQVTYLVVGNEPYIVRTADRYLGDSENKVDKIAIALSSPSSNTDLYIKTAHKNVVKMIKETGIKNAPFFMQGFVDGDKFRFYDPGLRYPGGNYERVFAQIMNTDLVKPIIESAFTGKIDSSIPINENTVYLNGNTIFTLHSVIRAGRISEMPNEKEMFDISGVKYFTYNYNVGDDVEFTGTVHQRISESIISCNSTEELKKSIKAVEDKLVVLDENKEDMVICKFNVDNFRECKRGE